MIKSDPSTYMTRSRIGSGPVTSQLPPEREPSGEDVLRGMREVRKALARDEDDRVFVGVVEGVAYFLPRGLVDRVQAVWEPRMGLRRV